LHAYALNVHGAKLLMEKVKICGDYFVDDEIGALIHSGKIKWMKTSVNILGDKQRGIFIQPW